MAARNSVMKIRSLGKLLPRKSSAVRPDRVSEEEQAVFWRSISWNRVRQYVRSRSRGVCEFCWQRRMHTAHHRINDRPGYSYETPHLHDLMAVCYECHDYLHREGVDIPLPQSAAKSPASIGDSGFSTRANSPGHWMRFTRGDRWWDALVTVVQPPLKVRYCPEIPPFKETVRLDAWLCDGHGPTPVRLKWNAIEASLQPVPPTQEELHRLFDAPEVRETWCFRCKAWLNSREFPICDECGKIICPCGACWCSYSAP